MTLLIQFSCAQKTEEKKSSLLESFWKSEIARLQKEKPKVMKITTVNGKTDTLITDSIDWERELQMFVKNDLKESDLGMYDADTIICHDTISYDDGDGNLLQKVSTSKAIKLVSKTEDFKIKELFFRQDKSHVLIVIEDREQLYGVNKRLVYITDRFYEITGSQDIKFIDNINYKVEVKFIDK